MKALKKPVFGIRTEWVPVSDLPVTPDSVTRKFGNIVCINCLKACHFKAKIHAHPARKQRDHPWRFFANQQHCIHREF